MEMEKDRNETQFTKKLFDTVHYRHMYSIGINGVHLPQEVHVGLRLVEPIPR